MTGVTEKGEGEAKISPEGRRAVPWKEVQEVLADLKTIYDDEKSYKRIEKLRRKTEIAGQ